MEAIFPEEIIKYSAEEHFNINMVKGRPVYIFFILLLLLVLVSLPMVKIDISYSSRGILRTMEEASKIGIAKEGILQYNALKLNKFVEMGDTLLIIDHSSLNEEISDTREAMQMLSEYLKDLDGLLVSGKTFITERYHLVHMEYSREMESLKNELDFSTDEFSTSEELYEGGFIARLDYESARKKYLATKARMSLRAKEYQNHWQSELSNYRLQYLQLKTKLSHLMNLLSMHYTIAPISGYISEYTELKPGTFLTVNEPIARIVPDQNLLASCLVTSDKISRIRLGQEVRLNVDTYPGSTYGRLEGKVISIPEDANNYSGTPAFPILCEIEQEFNKKGQGPEAILKSGMTFTALFIITRKSLLQLIIEKGEKLLLPSQNQDKHESIAKHSY